MKVKNILTIAKLTLAGIIAFSSACSQAKTPRITTQDDAYSYLNRGVDYYKKGEY